MKKTLKAFSYAEIITIVVIIGLVSSFGIVSFFDFMKGREVNGVIENVKLILKEEDNKINNKDIIDYNIMFQLNNKKHFIVFENIFDLENIINFDFTKNIVFVENLANEGGENINILVYEDGKLEYNGVLESSGYLLNLKDGVEYDISGYLLDGNKKKNLNNIKIIGFSSGNDIILSNITNNEVRINELNIISLGGIKSIQGNGIEIDNNNEINIFFEKDGIENFIKLN